MPLPILLPQIVVEQFSLYSIGILQLRQIIRINYPLQCLDIGLLHLWIIKKNALRFFRQKNWGFENKPCGHPVESDRLNFRVDRIVIKPQIMPTLCMRRRPKIRNCKKLPPGFFIENLIRIEITMRKQLTRSNAVSFSADKTSLEKTRFPLYRFSSLIAIDSSNRKK